MTVYGAGATRERQGWFFGLTGSQVALLLVAGLPNWLAMALSSWAYLSVLMPLWALLALLICLPVRGWSAFQWLGVLIRHLVGAAFGWSRFQSLAATGNLAAEDHSQDQAASGSGTPQPATYDVSNPGEADLPGILSPISILDGPPMSGRPIRPAIIQNHAARTWAATARVVHPGIGMTDEADRSRLGRGLAEMLEAATAGNQIDTLALQIRSVPDDGTERAAWVRTNARPHEPEVSTHVNNQLDQLTAGAAVRQEVFVTVVVREEVINKDARRSGRGVAGRARVLYALLSEIESRLVGSLGCTHVTWLDSGQLAVAIRTGFEPGDAPVLAAAALNHDHDPTYAVGIPIGAAGPAHSQTAMRSYRHGEWASVASTILLPRKGARMGALARALVPSQPGERRSMTVFFRPISHHGAERVTGRAEMSAAMGAEMRRKVGRIERAKDRHSAAQLRDRDERLQRGHSLVKVSSVIAITVPTTWSAQDFGRRLDASIRMCGFTPMPLDGAHDAAFAAAAIPLGAGVPNRRG